MLIFISYLPKSKRLFIFNCFQGFSQRLQIGNFRSSSLIFAMTVYLGPISMSKMEGFFGKIITGFKPLLFSQKALSQMFVEVLNTPLLSNNYDFIMSCSCGCV